MTAFHYLQCLGQRKEDFAIARVCAQKLKEASNVLQVVGVGKRMKMKQVLSFLKILSGRGISFCDGGDIDGNTEESIFIRLTSPSPCRSLLRVKSLHSHNNKLTLVVASFPFIWLSYIINAECIMYFPIITIKNFFHFLTYIHIRALYALDNGRL